LKYVVWFRDVDKDDVALVGGKGANLGELTRAGLPVPPGFIVTAKAYFDFLEETDIDLKIEKLLKNLDVNNTKELHSRALEIQKVIMAKPMPRAIAKEISAAYQKLYTGLASNLYVAVRSSATAEDLPSASFAGQQKTFLNIAGTENVLKAVRMAWASLFEARAIYYRQVNGFEHLKVGLAVPVQKMVQSEKSGIMFTVDPVSNDRGKIVIEAGWGLGEAIVSGAVTPDRYVILKKELKIEKKEINQQEWKIAKVAGVDKHVAIPKNEQKVQKLSDEEIKKLAEFGIKIDDHYQSPQDVEWAIEGKNIYFVQSRPVTTLMGGKSEIRNPKSEKLEETSPQATEAEVLVKGIAASIGIASGPVRIIHSPAEIDKVAQGEVLVTEKTNPDFVPAMKKAVAIVTDTGGQTCFAGDTLFLTNKGFLKIQEIIERINREDLFTLSLNPANLNLEWRKILSGGSRVSKVIEVDISQTGRALKNSLRLTPDHKMIIFKNRKLEKIPVSRLIADKGMVLGAHYIPPLDNPEDPPAQLYYLLGALNADGHIRLTSRRGRITFTQKVEDGKRKFIQAVNEIFYSFFGKKFRPKVKLAHSILRGREISGQATDYIAYSKTIATRLIKMKALLPQKILTFDEETLLSYLAGLIDGDGTFNPQSKRINLFVSKKDVLESAVLACLRLGIFPQVTYNRDIYNLQIVERLGDILARTQRVKGQWRKREMGTRFLAATQVLQDIINQANYKGRIKPYLKNGLLIDADKIQRNILPLVSQEVRTELEKIINSGLRNLRVRFRRHLPSQRVYNIEVENNHNYLAFTDNYSPILVKNSHAAIVSRELGIPCVVGTGTATAVLKNGQVVSVDGAKGLVYKGQVSRAEAPPQPSDGGGFTEEIPITATKVYVNLGEPSEAEKVAKLPCDGVGLLRAEFMIAEIGEHPRALVKAGKQDIYINKLVEGLSKTCAAFSPRPVVYRATDFKTNEYRNLKGGEQFEPQENNPMIGYRGAYRYLKEPDLFKLELEAIKKVRQTLANLWLMIPFVRTLEELRQVKELIAQSGLERSDDFKLWMMVEIPSNVILIDKFLDLGVDGVSIGSNDLTQLTLGIDRDNERLADEFDERDEAVEVSISHVIRHCRRRHVSVSICGQAATTFPEIAELMVREGATSVSVSPDSVIKTRKLVASVEKKIMLQKIIDER